MLLIRRARSDEAGLVLSLIRELAEYEKLLHEVEASEAMIADALFCASPRLFCDIAEWNAEVAGFAVWFVNFSTFSGRPGIYLEDLFVRPSLRGNGIGKEEAPYAIKKEAAPVQDIANGRVLASTFVKAGTVKGESKVELSQVAEAAMKDVADEVDEEAPSKESQKVVKDYFETMQKSQ